MVLDDSKKEVKYEIQTVDDLYKYADVVNEAVRKLDLAKNKVKDNVNSNDLLVRVRNEK